MEEQEIIEVEAIDKSIREAQPNKKPKKAKYQYGSRIELFVKIDWFCIRFFFPLFLIGVLGSWALWIGYYQHPENVFFLIFLILALVILGFSILMFASHFLWRALINAWKKKDPNYEG